MKIRLLLEQIPERAMFLRALLLRPETIIRDLVIGKPMQPIIPEAEKQQLLQTDRVLRQVLLIQEAIPRQVDLTITELIPTLCDQRDHILYRTILTELHQL